MPITDVIRAAVSEVEEYRRVALRRVDDALVAGAVVSGVAHMLAELVENGLAFSPPDADVEIQGRRIGDSYLIAITDQGIGMGHADLEMANQRLRGEGDFITAPTRFLGHYVVGRLATDMDIDVQLAPSPVTGVTARIVLPPSIVASTQAVTGSGQPPRLADEERVRVERPRALEASDPAATQVLTLPAGDPPPAPDGRIQSGTIEYVTVPGSPAVRHQPIEAEEPAGAGSPLARYEDAMTTSTMGMDMYSFAPPPDESERTPNGLKKRAPRARKKANTGPGQPGGTAPTRTAERPAPVSDSPDEVRARLTAFRSGMQRGSTESTD